jgi:hypothetical protein
MISGWSGNLNLRVGENDNIEDAGSKTTCKVEGQMGK